MTPTVPTIVQQYAPPSSYRVYPNRPITYIGAHHAADPLGGNVPTPKAGSSWHRLFRLDHVIYHTVPTNAAAHCILKNDLWPNHPSILRCPDGAVSNANYCGLQYEIEYNPADPNFEAPTQSQIEDFKWQVRQDYALFGVIPILPHGMLQSDKWPSEPHLFPWAEAGFVWHPNLGYIIETPPPNQDPDYMNPATDEHIKGWLETLKVGVNMSTGIMQFVAEAYRQGPPPHGHWRGPALHAPLSSPDNPQGEYEVHNEEGHLCKRHRFSAGIAEYNTVTGGLAWVQVVQYPGEITHQD